MKLIKQTLVIGILIITLYSCITTPPTLKISSEQDMTFSLVTYSNFHSDTLLSGEIIANGIFETPVTYQGFALLTINNTFPYPIIIGKDNIHLDFTSPEVAPGIKESAENRFFYDYYANYNLLNSRLRLYDDSKGKLGEKDPFYPTLLAQIDSVKKQKELFAASLPEKAYPVASAILQEKLVEETSWSIKDIEGLHEKQKEFVGFASKNYPYLKNSEQLSALIRQSFMMLEYVNYFENIDKTGEKKTDIANATELYRSEMFGQTRMWMDALKPFLPENLILAQCILTYYNRAMTSNAMEILSSFKKDAKCVGEDEKPINFPPTFDIVKSDGNSKITTQQFNTEKIIVMVDEECIFSKVLASQVAKDYEKSPIPIIILPKGELDAGILALDRLCVKDLYFLNGKEWVSEDVLDNHTYPYYIKLDASNKVIKESGDWADFGKW